MNKYLLVIITIFIVLLIITLITYYNNSIIEKFSSDCKSASDLGCFIGDDKDSWKKGAFCQDQNPLLCFMKRLFCMITVQKCDISNLNNTISALNTQKSNLSAQITTLTDNIKTLTDNETTLNTRIQTLTGSETTLSNALEALRTTHTQITAEKELLQRDFNTLDDDFKNKEAANKTKTEGLEKDIEDLSNEINDLQSSLDIADALIIKLNKDISDKTAQDAAKAAVDAETINQFGALFGGLTSSTTPAADESPAQIVEETPSPEERLRSFENQCKNEFKCDNAMIPDKILANYNEEYGSKAAGQGYTAQPYTLTKVGDQECKFEYTFTRNESHFPESPESGTGKRTYKFKLLNPDPDAQCNWEIDGKYQTVQTSLEKSYTQPAAPEPEPVPEVEPEPEPEPEAEPEPAPVASGQDFGFGDTSEEDSAYLIGRGSSVVGGFFGGGGGAEPEPEPAPAPAPAPAAEPEPAPAVEPEPAPAPAPADNGFGGDSWGDDDFGGDDDDDWDDEESW